MMVGSHRSIGVLFCTVAACGYPTLAPLVERNDGGAVDTPGDTATGPAPDATMGGAPDATIGGAPDATVDAVADAAADAAVDAGVDAATTHPRRMMLVLIDATGSMAQPRGDSKTRFEGAQKVAKDHVRAEAASADGLAGVAIYSFHDEGIEAHTTGFIDPTTAGNRIDTLTLSFSSSPLAGSLCDAIDVLSGAGGNDVTKLLEVLLDGGENNTPAAHPCAGPSSSGELPPFDAGSWQNKVWNKAGGSRAHPTITFFGAGSLQAQLRAQAVHPDLTDPNFFSSLALANGGQFHQIFDDQPLPGARARP